MPGVFDSHFPSQWKTGGGINGGFLMAVAARAAATAMNVQTDEFFPSSISANFLTASKAGTATVHAEVIRQGSRLSTGQISIVQEGNDGNERERLRALVTHGKLETQPVVDLPTPPRIPGPEDCVSRRDTPPDFLERVETLDPLDIRLDPACAGWIFGRPSGIGRFNGWVRLTDGGVPDPMLLLVAADSLPPVSFDFGHLGWFPTVQMTAHIRARPAPGWLQVSNSARTICNECVIEDAEVWDSEGTLILQTRQLSVPV